MRRLVRFGVTRRGPIPGAWWATLATAFAASLVLGAGDFGPHQTPTVGTSRDFRDVAQTLETGRKLERELTAGQRDTFSIAVAEGQCANLRIEPGGGDLAVRLFAPDRAGVELPVTRRSIQLPLTVPGAVVFRLEIEPEHPRAAAGKYTILLEKPRPATERDRALFEANELDSESRRLFHSGAYEKAQASAERALQLRERALGENDAEVAASLLDLGDILVARSEFARAETALQRALAIREKAFGHESPDTAEVLNALAKNSYARGDYAEAERRAKEGLAIREKAPGADHFLVAESLGTLADIYYEKSEPAKARAASDRALEIAGKSYGPDDLPYAEFLTRAGRLQGDQGNFPRAEELCSRALEIAEKTTGKDSLQTSDALQGLASVTLWKGDNVRSEQLHRHVLEIRERILGRDHLEVGMTLHNLATLAYRRQDYESAEPMFRRALAIKEKALGPVHPWVGYTLNNLGLLYWRQRDYSKAEQFFRRTLDLCEKAYGPESYRVGQALGNLGIVSKESGDYDRAEGYYRRQLAIQERAYGPQSPNIRAAIESLAILYRDRGDYAAAEPMFLRTLKIMEESLGPDNPEVARLLQNLAQLYSAKGDTVKALQCLERLNAIEEKNLPLNLAVGSERQKLAYFDPLATNLEKIISFQVRQDPSDPSARDLAATTLLQRKGRILDAMTDSLASLHERSNAEDRALLDQLKNVTTQLATLVLNGPQKMSIKEHQERVKALAEQREKLEEQVNRRSAGFYERSGSVTLAAVQRAIPADSVLIEFAVYRPFDPKEAIESKKRFGDPRYAAYVIPGRGEVRWIDLGPASEIDRGVDLLRRTLRDPKRTDVRRAARALDERVMRPIRGLAGNATRLLISPDGQLDLIPFETLADERGRYLIESHSVTYLTAGRDLLRMQVARASKTDFLVVADPLFGEPAASLVAESRPAVVKTARAAEARRSITTGEDLSSVYFAPLPGTAEEAHTIHALFPRAQVLTGREATEDALKRVNAPRILHIATHGFFLRDAASDSTPGPARSATAGTRAINATTRIENPLLRSGLALAGANLNRAGGDAGILTALEAANLNLWGTKLVTLSACDTGVGEVKNGEGVYGLRRAFFLAGAETLVMSLWPVSDYVTREMMASYYKGLKKGLGRGEALRQAQLGMLKRNGRAHPFYWASFIQSGEWANLEGQR